MRVLLTHRTIKHVLMRSSEMPGIKHSQAQPLLRANSDAYRVGLMSWQPHGLILGAGETYSKNIHPSQKPLCLEFHHEREISGSAGILSDSQSLGFRYKPENIQPCTMKNKDIFGEGTRYKTHCTQDNDISVPVQVGTLGPHTVLPIAISCPVIFS